ncbi:DUF1254 domain-containing protein [Achromobacter spanius]|uniref:DUF1254 domain-containing protein n=1 Tax=Achromobacter spanius TaxID=217203 RepID=UPI0026D9AFDF
MIFRAALLAMTCVATANAHEPAYRFERGYPTPSTSQQSRADQTLQRAVVAYRFWYPTVSMEGIFNGNRAAGIADGKQWGIAATGPRQVGFTLNSDTPYGSAVLDLTRGPMVIDLPPGAFIGLVNDHNQGWVQDLGLPGPDAGKGGQTYRATARIHGTCARRLPRRQIPVTEEPARHPGTSGGR